MTLSGLSRFNVENALAAASAALAAGIVRTHVITGLRSFRPDPEHNPGRMNFFTLPIGRPGEISVVMDLAHNEAGLEAMIEIMRGVGAPSRRLLLGLGAVGDRQDDLLEMLGEIAARDADVVVIGHKEKYLRGRTIEELESLLRAGAERVGVTDIEAYPTELESLQALVAIAEPGDVVGLMCHAQRQEVYDWLDEQGATAGQPRAAKTQGRPCQRSELTGPRPTSRVTGSWSSAPRAAGSPWPRSPWAPVSRCWTAPSSTSRCARSAPT